MYTISLSQQGKASGNKAALWLRTKLQWHLFHLGRFVQRHAGKVLFVGLLVLSTFCVGLKSASIQTDVEKLWVEGKKNETSTTASSPSVRHPLLYILVVEIYLNRSPDLMSSIRLSFWGLPTHTHTLGRKELEPPKIDGSLFFVVPTLNPPASADSLTRLAAFDPASSSLSRSSPWNV